MEHNLAAAFWQIEHDVAVLWETRMDTCHLLLGRWADAHIRGTRQLLGEWLLGRLTWRNAKWEPWVLVLAMSCLFVR